MIGKIERLNNKGFAALMISGVIGLVGALVFMLVGLNLIEPVADAKAGVNTTNLSAGAGAILGISDLAVVVGVAIGGFAMFFLPALAITKKL